MNQAQNGNTVKVHYKGTLKDGAVFDSSLEREPLEFTIGEGRLLKDFEDAIVGMTVGDKKTIDIEAANAYGVYQDNLQMNVDRSQLPADMEPQVGMQLQTTLQEGHVVILVVKEIHENTVVLDANHPLAGKDLTFELELMEIK